ncbi:MAG: hypothetical protein ALAOOOJD_00952 [bacterium]|nr:hypothetical protein [bacterium]
MNRKSVELRNTQIAVDHFPGVAQIARTRNAAVAAVVQRRRVGGKIEGKLVMIGMHIRQTLRIALRIIRAGPHALLRPRVPAVGGFVNIETGNEDGVGIGRMHDDRVVIITL